MAVGTSYKQACPSCEAMVLIRDISLVGKKVECPKCKYRFQAEKPKGKDGKAGKKFRDKSEEEPVEVDELETVEEDGDVAPPDDEEPARKTKPQTKKGAAPKLKPQVKKGVKEEEAEELEEIVEPDEDEEDEAPRRQAKDKKKAAAAKDEEEEEDADDKGAAEEDEGETSEDDEDDKKKKKKGNKMMLGLALAGVGVVVLGIGGVSMMILGGGGGPKGPKVANPPMTANANPGTNPAPTTPTPIEEKKDTKEEKKGETKPAEEVKAEAVADLPATNEVELALLTHLIPTEAEHVLHLYNRNLFAPNSPLRTAIFEGDGVLNDAQMHKQLGFSVLAMDDLIRAERYSGQTPWTFTILHFREPLNETEVIKALKLKPPSNPGKKTYYEMSEPNPYLESLAHLSLGVPTQVRLLDDRPPGRPSFVLLHGKQTLIVADDVPLQAFLKVDGSFPIQSDTPKADANAQQQQSPMLEGTNWEVTNTFADGAVKGRFELLKDGQAKLTDAKKVVHMGTWQLTGENFSLTIPDKSISYNGMYKDKALSGDASEPGKDNWKWTATQEAAGGKAGIFGSDPRTEMYLTIRPDLKKVLDKMENVGTDHQVLYSSATALDAAVVRTGVGETGVARRPRQLWDTVLLLHEPRPRLRILGTALVQKARNLQYRNQLVCTQEPDVKEYQRELVERVAPQVGVFLEQLLGAKIELPKLDAQAAAPANGGPNAGPGPMPPGPMPGYPRPGGSGLRPGMGPGFGPRNPMGPQGPMPPMPTAPAAEAKGSRILVTAGENSDIEFTLDLMPDGQAVMGRLYNLMSLAAGALRAEMDLAASAPARARYQLAGAGKQLGEQGLSKLEVPPGTWPPGAFKRQSLQRADREPMNRIGWMAGLLPYLGHQGLFDRLEFKDSWRDPSNWLAARTLVLQFLDPSYPDLARFTTVPGLPTDLGATHYVGIAGIGLDAATYDPRDPATRHKRGVLNYEGSASIAEIQKSRNGLGQTILLIQVPHDGVTGVSPWIAGGGATLRGVPEKNSIAPFVLSNDRNGKRIQHQGKNGTYALMTDGSVRFISENVADDVFQAMCTVNGPAPEKFNLDQDENTPLVVDPNAKVKKTTTGKKDDKKPAAPPKDDKKPAADEKKAETKGEPAVKTETKEEKKTAPPVKTETKEEKKAETKEEKKAEEKKAPPKDEKKVSWHHRPAPVSATPVATMQARPRRPTEGTIPRFLV